MFVNRNAAFALQAIVTCRLLKIRGITPAGPALTATCGIITTEEKAKGMNSRKTYTQTWTAARWVRACLCGAWRATARAAADLPAVCAACVYSSQCSQYCSSCMMPHLLATSFAPAGGAAEVPHQAGGAGAGRHGR